MAPESMRELLARAAVRLGEKVKSLKTRAELLQALGETTSSPPAPHSPTLVTHGFFIRATHES